MTRILYAVTTFLAAAVLSAPAGAAQSVADHYRDRTVTILVGYGAGGTYGQTALLLTSYLGKHIPGNPTVIVQHMPGAGGIRAANYAYNAMPKNGHYILMPPEMTLVSQLLRPEKVKYVTSGFTWLGTVFGANQVMIVRRDTGVRSLEDVKKREIVVASTGPGSPTYLIPAMMNGILGTKFKIVTGYKGSAETTLAVERNEAFGMTNSWVSWQKNRGPWFKGGDSSFAVKLSQVGYTKEPDLQDLPLLTELATNPDDRAAAAMLSTQSVIGRGLAMPPGVPHDLIEPLRKAFWATVTDPEFKADGKKRQLPVVPIKGAELQKIIVEAMQMSPTAVEKARRYIFPKKKK